MNYVLLILLLGCPTILGLAGIIIGIRQYNIGKISRIVTILVGLAFLGYGLLSIWGVLYFMYGNW